VDGACCPSCCHTAGPHQVKDRLGLQTLKEGQGLTRNLVHVVFLTPGGRIARSSRAETLPNTRPSVHLPALPARRSARSTSMPDGTEQQNRATGPNPRPRRRPAADVTFSTRGAES